MKVIINGKTTEQTATWLTYDQIARITGIKNPVVSIQHPAGHGGPIRSHESVTLDDGLTINAFDAGIE